MAGVAPSPERQAMYFAESNLSVLSSVDSLKSAGARLVSSYAITDLVPLQKPNLKNNERYMTRLHELV